MTRVTILLEGLPVDTKTFTFRFQARTWLLLNGYLFDSDNLKLFEHINNGCIAELNSRTIP